MMKLAPSLLEADYRFLDEQLKTMERAGADYVHIDVMDGAFVPNIALGMREIQSIRPATSLVFDVHMMVNEPIRYVRRIKEAGADIIIVHSEACEDLEKTILTIKKLGVKAGVALKPETPIDVLPENVLRNIDVVQLMTVQPGREGQKFIPESLQKIRELRDLILQMKLKCEIGVDGNIGIHNVRDVICAGATVVVSGKALFSGNLEDNVRNMKNVMSEAGKEEVL